MNTPETFFRVQDECGRGPYQARYDTGKEEVAATLNSHDRYNGHPPPSCDIGIKRDIKSFEGCGFASLRQIRSWFTKKELVVLANHGLHVHKMQGMVTAIGEKQLLFKITSAKSLGIVPTQEIFAS